MLNVYFCGGTGINLSKQLKAINTNMALIDTSTSNTKGIGDDIKFVVPGVDGAGKDRSISYEAFKPYIEEILIRFKPSEQLNVVVSSLSGGTGSVIGPLITRELISNDYNTIVIGIDSEHSLKELDNTLKTLKTYRAVSDSTNKSISLFYVKNTSRKEADLRAIQFINLLSLLVNREHTEEFDTTDLSNFINYNKVTDNKPSVSVVDVSENTNIIPNKNTTIVSTILVTKDSNSVIKPITPEYLATCVVTNTEYDNEDIRIDNVLGSLAILVDSLETLVKDYHNNKKINKFKEVDIASSTEEGIVL